MSRRTPETKNKEFPGVSRSDPHNPRGVGPTEGCRSIRADFPCLLTTVVLNRFALHDRKSSFSRLTIFVINNKYVKIYYIKVLLEGGKKPLET